MTPRSTWIAPLLFAVACQAPAPRSPYPGAPAWGVGEQAPRALAPAEVAPFSAAGARTRAGVPEDLSRRLPPAPSAPARGGRGGPGGAPQAAAPAPPAAPRSVLEALYAGQDPGVRLEELAQFGYDAFGAAGLRDAPRVPPTDYRLGPGDEVLVQLTGSHELRERIRIDGEGQVRLEEVNPVSALGVTVEVLERRIHAAFAVRRKGFETHVSLSKVRSVRVHVTGHVSRPGPVWIPATGGVLEALVAAGGPEKTGSLRRVERREGERVEVCDLYRYLRGDDRLLGPPLREGECLHVPAIGPTVAVVGRVGAPAIYELVDPCSVADVLLLAGGLSPFAFAPQVRVERTVEGRARRRLEVSAPYAEPVHPGDAIRVESVEAERLDPQVRIGGEVLRPGAYGLTSGLTLGELVRRAGGATVEAYLPQAIVSRRLTAADGGAPRAERSVRVVDLGRALEGDPDHDLALRALDYVRVLARRDAEATPEVEVSGAVLRPGRYALTQGLRVSDLLALAGNPLRTANPQAELLRRVLDRERGARSVERYGVDLHAERGAVGDPLLAPDDRLIVRALRADTVRVSVTGEVRHPGAYELPLGARISELVEAAGGLLPSADLRASVFTRERVRQQQQERLRHLAERTRRLNEQALEQLLQEGHGNEALAARVALRQSQQTVARMQRAEATGRIVLPLARWDFPGSAGDLVLEGGDSLQVERRMQTVSVAGHVVNPSTFVARAGLTVEDAVADAGGLLEDGDDERVYVIRADGVVQSLAQSTRPLEWESALLPGDVVLVPRRPLERALGNQLADGLAMARQMAEIALIASKAASPSSSVALTSQAPESPPQRVGGYEAAAGR